MLFAVCADRGAPGSTTTALVIAAARGLPALVVEADPYGGDLALRLRPDGKHPMPATPTVLSVGAGRSARVTPSRPGFQEPPSSRHKDLWHEESHQLTDLVGVVPGFSYAEQGSSLAWPVLTSALQSQTVPVFADLGRIHTGSPSLPIAAAADVLITVCRGDSPSVHHMAERLETLVPAVANSNGRPPAVLPVVIAPRKHGDRMAASVAQILAGTAIGPTVRGVGWLAWDPDAVSLLEDGADPWSKPLSKSPLMKSARKVMRLLAMTTGIDHAEPTASKNARVPEMTATPNAVQPTAPVAQPVAQPVAPAAPATPTYAPAQPTTPRPAAMQPSVTHQPNLDPAEPPASPARPPSSPAPATPAAEPARPAAQDGDDSPAPSGWGRRPVHSPVNGHGSDSQRRNGVPQRTGDPAGSAGPRLTTTVNGVAAENDQQTAAPIARPASPSRPGVETEVEDSSERTQERPRWQDMTPETDVSPGAEEMRRRLSPVQEES